MAENFIPLLPTVDWNDEWKELQHLRRRADDSTYWDKRAKTFSTKDSPNPYVTCFLERARIEPGESVLDMGCGTGALTLPLAEQGHAVTAADFSSGMLDMLRQNLNEQTGRIVTVKQMSWEDDWKSQGIAERSVDVALASRSIATADLKESLLKIDTVARRRVCITLSTNSSPRIDENLLGKIGLASPYGHDYIYAFNILAQIGIKPEISYIKSMRKDTFDTLDEAFHDFSKMVEDTGHSLNGDKREAALARLRNWLAEHVVENPEAGKPDTKGLIQKKLCLDEARFVTWAFIAWDKE